MELVLDLLKHQQKVPPIPHLVSRLQAVLQLTASDPCVEPQGPASGPAQTHVEFRYQAPMESEARHPQGDQGHCPEALR